MSVFIPYYEYIEIISSFASLSRAGRLCVRLAGVFSDIHPRAKKIGFPHIPRRAFATLDHREKAEAFGVAQEGAVAGVGDDVEPFRLGFGYGHTDILDGCFCNRITRGRG